MGRPPFLAIGSAIWQYYQSRAAQAVQSAIATGDLAPINGQHCVRCGYPAAVYDHRNYLRPLDVQAVCDTCNRRLGPADLECDGVIAHIASGLVFENANHRHAIALGSIKSAKKARASRENGKKGGRPKLSNKVKTPT